MDSKNSVRQPHTKIFLRNCGVDPLEALFGAAYDDVRQSVEDEIDRMLESGTSIGDIRFMQIFDRKLKELCAKEKE